MAKVKGSDNSKPSRSTRTPLTPENRDNELVSLAYDCAKEQLSDRTASSQVITHFLKMGTEKARLEREKLENENLLLRAKTDAIQSAQHIEELYANAIKAMQRYGGDMREGDDYEDFEDY